MGAATGVLNVVTPDGTVRHEWNGDPEDKAKARAAFEELMQDGFYLATVQTGERTRQQVRTFDEVLDKEKEVGTVEAQISPALVGG